MKTEVYAWRLSRSTKAQLEQAARAQGIRMSALLDRVTSEWLARPDHLDQDDKSEQIRLRAAAGPFIGAIRGSNPNRSRSVRELIRERLKKQRKRYERPRTD